MVKKVPNIVLSVLASKIGRPQYHDPGISVAQALEAITRVSHLARGLFTRREYHIERKS